MAVNFLLSDLKRGRNPLYIDGFAVSSLSTAKRLLTTGQVAKIKGTRFIGLTVTTATVYINHEGGKILPTTTGGNGWAVGHYWLPWSDELLDQSWIISATGAVYITFWTME